MNADIDVAAAVADLPGAMADLPASCSYSLVSPAGPGGSAGLAGFPGWPIIRVDGPEAELVPWLAAAGYDREGRAS